MLKLKPLQEDKSIGISCSRVYSVLSPYSGGPGPGERTGDAQVGIVGNFGQ